MFVAALLPFNIRGLDWLGFHTEALSGGSPLCLDITVEHQWVQNDLRITILPDGSGSASGDDKDDHKDDPGRDPGCMEWSGGPWGFVQPGMGNFVAYERIREAFEWLVGQEGEREKQKELGVVM